MPASARAARQPSEPHSRRSLTDPRAEATPAAGSAICPANRDPPPPTAECVATARPRQAIQPQARVATLAGGRGPVEPLLRIVRLAFRLVWLAAEILRAALDFFINVGSLQGGLRLRARARCLQRGSQRVLRVLDVRVCASGGVPPQGLLVCNHLSYLDILVLGALTPVIFVAKSEVKHWLIFGWFARLAGTLFVERDCRTDVARLVAEMEAVLRQGVVLVLFAEGTSSDGRSVLPFKSSLLEPAARLHWPVWAGRLSYGLMDGDPAEEVCYWRDMTFGPHLLNLLTKRRVSATLRLAKLHADCTDRKDLARRLHAEVSRL